MVPIISIITATYNSEKYIDRCLRSVFDQEFTDWELIIIDDFSSDNTAKKVDDLIKKDSRIRFIRHKKNWGVLNLHKTYNQALKLSRGEYIAMLEGDDWWPSNKFESQIKDFEDKKVILSYGNAILTNANGEPVKVISYSGDKNKLNNTPVPSILEKFADFNFFFLVSTLIMRRDALVKIGGFKKNPHFAFVDVPTWYELSLKGAFHCNRNILGYYRRHKNSSWVEVAKDSDAMLRTEMQKMYWEFIRKNEIVLQKHGFKIDKKALMSLQKKALSKKRRNKNFSLFMNAILYGDSQILRKTARQALFESGGIGLGIKLFILIILLIGPFKNALIFFYFYIQYICYRLKKVFQVNILGS